MLNGEVPNQQPVEDLRDLSGAKAVPTSKSRGQGSRVTTVATEELGLEETEVDCPHASASR